MHYRLSCAANRVEGKLGFVLESNGRMLESSVKPLVSSNIKENILESVYRGLRVSRGYLKHEDILFIEIQNVHLCEWLSGRKEYKGYEEYLEKVFEVIESINCKYRYIFVKNPYAKRYIDFTEIDKLKTSSLASVMEEFSE